MEEVVHGREILLVEANISKKKIIKILIFLPYVYQNFFAQVLPNKVRYSTYKGQGKKLQQRRPFEKPPLLIPIRGAQLENLQFTS